MAFWTSQSITYFGMGASTIEAEGKSQKLFPYVKQQKKM